MQYYINALKLITKIYHKNIHNYSIMIFKIVHISKNIYFIFLIKINNQSKKAEYKYFDYLKHISK